MNSAKPTIPRKFIISNTEDLLIGSGNGDNEVFEELLNSEAKVEDIIEFYDYIEIQPKHHYANFIRNERIADNASLEEILEKLIQLAKKRKNCCSDRRLLLFR